MRWASLSGSVEGKPVRQLWLKHGEGEDLQSIENVLKPVQSMAICISLSYAGINLQPLQAKAGGRCQALVPWQPPTPCHDAEVTQASSQAESFVKFPTGTPCSRGGGVQPRPRTTDGWQMQSALSWLAGAPFSRRGVWARFTGPAQRSAVPASTVRAGKGLCSPSMPADTAVAKLADRIGQNAPKPHRHSLLSLGFNCSSRSSSFPYMALAKPALLHILQTFFLHDTKQMNFSEMLSECLVPPVLTVAFQGPLFR